MAVKRAAVVLDAASGMTVPQISQSQSVHQTYVRKILNDFNVVGLASIGNRYGQGRPVIFDDIVTREIIQVVTSPPRQWGLPFTVWSVAKLGDHLMAHGVVNSISIEWLRQILLDAKSRRRRPRRGSSPMILSIFKKNGLNAIIRMRKQGAGASSAWMSLDR